MTTDEAREVGRLGGLKVFADRGTEYFRELGRKGGVVSRRNARRAKVTEGAPADGG